MAKKLVKSKTQSTVEVSEAPVQKPKANALRDKLVAYYNEIDEISIEEQNAKIEKIKAQLEEILPKCEEYNEKVEKDLFKKINKELYSAGFMIKRNRHGAYYHVRLPDAKTGYIPNYKMTIGLICLGVVIIALVMAMFLI